jgi:uncharacterized protein (DUF433 family)
MSSHADLRVCSRNALRYTHRRLPATLIAEPLPLHEDSSGTIRVGESRVTLDSVVHAYESGQWPEQIAENYPVLTLAHVFGALSFYHQHRDEVRRYLEQREREADAMQREIEANQPPLTRSELEARLRRGRREQ